MAANHFIVPTGVTEKVTTVRLWLVTLLETVTAMLIKVNWSKFVAESRYDLCAAGDAIEGVVVGRERYVRRLLCWRHYQRRYDLCYC